MTEQLSPQKFQFHVLNDDSKTPNKHPYNVHHTPEAALLEDTEESVQPPSVQLNVADAVRKEREEQEIRNQKVGSLCFDGFVLALLKRFCNCLKAKIWRFLN